MFGWYVAASSLEEPISAVCDETIAWTGRRHAVLADTHMTHTVCIFREISRT